MTVQRLSATIAVAILGVAAALLTSVPPVQAFPWDTDMFRGPQISALDVAPREMPNGTLPTDGIHYNNHWGQPEGVPDEKALPPLKLEIMTVKLHNPLQPTAENLAKGKVRFETNCAACHGDHGLGNGPVVHLLAHKPANLLTGVSKNLPDGYIYGYIRDGGIWMPAYDDAMSSTERWQTVLYVRELQHQYGSETASKTVSPPPLAKGEVAVQGRNVTDNEKKYNEIGSESP